jgi:putative SOS response-associated peptidase YedK
LCAARWGLVPSWWRQAQFPRLTFNARSEDAASKPMWRQAYRQSRCLMPAEGWYEWQETEVVDRSTGEVRKVKQPYFIHCESEPVIAFAAMASYWAKPESEPLVSCAVLTTKAAPGLEYIHERMPVVLAAGDIDAWLDPHLSVEAVGEILSGPKLALQSYAVSTLVNNARNESPDLIKGVATTGIGSA